MGVVKQVENTTVTFVSLLALGLVGLLFLIIFGNLSNNLGFSQVAGTVITVTNETNLDNPPHANFTGYELSGFNSTWQSITITEVHNASTGNYIQFVPVANVSVTTAGVVTNATNTDYFNITISYTYHQNVDSQALSDTNNVITNLTSGAATFFTFANVWFVLLAIVILIIIVISVIRLVQPKSAGSTFSE